MPDVHGPGRVGRHVLDVDPLALAEVGAPIVRPVLQDGRDDAVPERRPKAQVEEARPRHLDLVDVGIGFELVAELVGDVARLHPGRLGQHQRGVAGEIAVRGIARRRHLDVGEVEPAGKRAIGLQRLQRGEDAAVHERVDVHRQFRHRQSRPRAVATMRRANAIPG